MSAADAHQEGIASAIEGIQETAFRMGVQVALMDHAASYHHMLLGDNPSNPHAANAVDWTDKVAKKMAECHLMLCAIAGELKAYAADIS